MLPLSAIVFLILGNIAGKQGTATKIPYMATASITVLFSIFLLPGLLEASSWASSRKNLDLPNFELVGLEGDKFTRDNLKGEVTWLEFYTTTCRPCFVEMASTSKVAQKFKGNDKVNFITALTAAHQPYEKFLNENSFHEFDLWHGYDHDTLLGRKFTPNGVPVGLLIDKEGEVRFLKEGFSDADAPYFEEKLEKRIHMLLAGE